MLNEKDRKALSWSLGKYGRVVEFAVILVPLFLVVSGFVNLYFASRIGSLEGYGLAELLKDWATGVDTKAQYSGVYVKAIGRITLAFFSFGFALVLALQVYAYHTIRQRDRRIVATLRSCGYWDE